MRYAQLTPLLDDLRPQTILEVGTWNGQRAIQMMHAARGMVYFGFDLFDAATPADDQAELNVKAHYSAEYVRSTLPFPNKLYKGYSRDTLPAFLEEYGSGRVDFAFIDGGHSVETIAEDWRYVSEIVKPGGVVVFDDYYPDASEADLDQFGANRILEEIGDFEVLPMMDPVVNGWHVQMAKV